MDVEEKLDVTEIDCGADTCSSTIINSNVLISQSSGASLLYDSTSQNSDGISNSSRTYSTYESSWDELSHETGSGCDIVPLCSTPINSPEVLRKLEDCIDSQDLSPIFGPQFTVIDSELQTEEKFLEELPQDEEKEAKNELNGADCLKMKPTNIVYEAVDAGQKQAVEIVTLEKEGYDVFSPNNSSSNISIPNDDASKEYECPLEPKKPIRRVSDGYTICIRHPSKEFMRSNLPATEDSLLAPKKKKMN